MDEDAHENAHERNQVEEKEQVDSIGMSDGRTNGDDGKRNLTSSSRLPKKTSLQQAARVIANLVVAAGGVLIRAGVQAYRQAIVSEFPLKALSFLVLFPLSSLSRPSTFSSSRLSFPLSLFSPATFCRKNSCRRRQTGQHGDRPRRLGCEIRLPDEPRGSQEDPRGRDAGVARGATEKVQPLVQSQRRARVVLLDE